MYGSFVPSNRKMHQQFAFSGSSLCKNFAKSLLDSELRLFFLFPQVAERALFLWNNDHIRNLITQNYKVIMPIVFPAMERNTRGHWHQAVQSLTLNVRKVLAETDQALFDECLAKFQEDEVNTTEVVVKREATWKLLEDLAASKTVSNEAVLLSRFSSSVTLATGKTSAS